MEEMTTIQTGSNNSSSESSPKEIRIIAADFGAWKARRRRFLSKSDTALLEEMINKRDKEIRRLHKEVDNFKAKWETSEKSHANLVLQTSAEIESLNQALTEAKKDQTELQKVTEEKIALEKQNCELSDELDASMVKAPEIERMQDLCEGRGALLEDLQDEVKRQQSMIDQFRTLMVGLSNVRYRGSSQILD